MCAELSCCAEPPNKCELKVTSRMTIRPTLLQTQVCWKVLCTGDLAVVVVLLTNYNLSCCIHNHCVLRLLNMSDWLVPCDCHLMAASTACHLLRAVAIIQPCKCLHSPRTPCPPPPLLHCPPPRPSPALPPFSRSAHLTSSPPCVCPTSPNSTT